MIKSYFTSILRNFSKNKVFTFINVFGLTIAICLGILLMLYVYAEMSTDKFHEKRDQIYRLVNLTNKRVKTNVFFAEYVKDNFPEVEKTCRYALFGGNWYYQDHEYNLDKVFICEPSIFDIFSYNFLIGSSGSAFSDPNSIVLTKSTASRFFGNEDPMNKIIKLNNAYSLRVSGVIDDFAANSSYSAQALIPFDVMKEWRPELWTNEGFWSVSTLLLMNKKVDVDKFHEKLQPMIVERFNRESDFTIQPLSDIYYNNTISDDEPHGNKNLMILFIVIVIIIIVIASINYINITTARAPLRAKEIGLRKVVGASRNVLVWQYLVESCIISLFSLFLGFVLAELFIGTFNTYVNSNLLVKTFYSIKFLPFIILSGIIFGLLSGLYPSFFITSFKTTEVLKGTRSGKVGGSSLRRILLVFQFVISICLMVATIAVYKQLSFVKHLDIGFKKDHIVCLNLPPLQGRQDSIMHEIKTFKKELLNIPTVETAAYSEGIPGRVRNGMVGKNSVTGEQIQMRHIMVESEFIDLYGLEIIEGRNFKVDNIDDQKNSFLITEEALNKFDLRDLYNAKIYGRKCIGVVKDFNFKSLHTPIEPLFITNIPQFTDLSIRMNPNNIDQTMKDIEKLWNRFFPDLVMDYNFVDEVFDLQYRREEQLGKVFIYFSVFSIFIASLGLLGLSSYLIIQRTKEIGIRKVMGGSLKNIIVLLSKEFVVLISIAFVISIPLSWLLVNSLLENFAYKTQFSWWIYAIAGVSALIITMVTVTIQIWKVIIKNPIDSLRYE